MHLITNADGLQTGGVYQEQPSKETIPGLLPPMKRNMTVFLFVQSNGR